VKIRHFPYNKCGRGIDHLHLIIFPFSSLFGTRRLPFSSPQDVVAPLLPIPSLIKGVTTLSPAPVSVHLAFFHIPFYFTSHK